LYPGPRSMAGAVLSDETEIPMARNRNLPFGMVIFSETIDKNPKIWYTIHKSCQGGYFV